MKPEHQLQSELEKLHSECVESMETIYTEELKEVIQWFAEKFPKRKLEWFNGMGTCGWMIDGEIEDLDYYTCGECSPYSGQWTMIPMKLNRRKRTLMPLVEFQKSFENVTWHPGQLELPELETSPLTRENKNEI